MAFLHFERRFPALIAFAVVLGAGNPLFAQSDPGSSTPLPAAALSKVPQELVERLNEGQAQDVIVAFEHGDIRDLASGLRLRNGLKSEDASIIARKAEHYRALRQRVLSRVMQRGVRLRKAYTHLPMAALRIENAPALQVLLRDEEVAGVYEDEQLVPVLTESLPLIRQPDAQFDGAGTTVAVLDTGLDYTRGAFGSCTAPGTPAGCRVPVAIDFAPNDGQRDANGHGTFVGGIVAGVATGTRIAALDVFTGSSAYASDIIAAIDWSIANREAYNIVALNLSLGSAGQGWKTECTISWATVPFADARNAGIVPVVASGNDGFTNRISSPACAPGAVRVGAVYDANLGGVSWSACTDLITAADRVVCFSNSAPYLTLLAPGSEINAAGYIGSGTSMATPHVAGAVAVLRSAFPADGVQQTVDRMVSTGKPITDPKNNITTPRLDLAAAEDTGAAMKLVEVDRTADAVDEVWYTVDLNENFAGPPVVLASMQGFDGGDTAGLRLRGVGAGGFEVFVEEEQSANSETGHTFEVVGYAAFEPGAVTDIGDFPIGEAGTVTIDQSGRDQWHTLTLAGSYVDPVVVMTMATHNGAQPAHLRLRNVTTGSFEWRIEEWGYLDGAHITETMAYAVFESGVHTLADGRVMEVGMVDADHAWTAVDFAAGFGSPPVVLSHGQTVFGGAPIVTRHRNVTSAGADLRVQEEEGFDGIHPLEAVGYFAIER